MIVAACTINSETKERLCDGSHIILNFILSHDGLHRGTLLALSHFVPRSGHQKTRGDDGIGVIGIKNVAGQLLPHEFVIRHIAVERVDDPVTVVPRIRA